MDTDTIALRDLFTLLTPAEIEEHFADVQEQDLLLCTRAFKRKRSEVYESLWCAEDLVVFRTPIKDIHIGYSRSKSLLMAYRPTGWRLWIYNDISAGIDDCFSHILGGWNEAGCSCDDCIQVIIDNEINKIKRCVIDTDFKAAVRSFINP